jgi:sucrose-6-phosphate hydrolase SacC (GH32 family)
MYYPGPGGILVARSTDGLKFEPVGVAIRNDGPGSALQMVSNPAIIVLRDGSYRMIYEGQDQKKDRRLYSAVSADGRKWTQEPGVRFADKGDEGDGLFTSVPDIFRLPSGDLRMYYTRGQSSATAISKDDGITWTKEGDLELGRIALDPDIVRLSDGSYILFFTSFDRMFGVGDQYVMSARSADGIHFTVDSGKRLEPSQKGWMVVDPDIILLPDGGYRMYYGEMGGGGMQSQILSAVTGKA